MTGVPLMRTSKCRCGPKQRPVQSLIADHLALADRLPDVTAKRCLVAVAGRHRGGVLDAGVVAVAALPARDRHAARVGGVDLRARRHADVDARVAGLPRAPLAEGRGDRAVHRPDQRPEPCLIGPPPPCGVKAFGAALRSCDSIWSCWASRLFRSSCAFSRLERTWASTALRPSRARWSCVARATRAGPSRPPPRCAG